MKSVLIIAALASMCAVQALAQPVEPKDGLMDRLSVDQIMRLSTLPPARIAEMRCAGFGHWLVAHRPRDAKSPNSAAADRLSAEVAAAIANDAELPADVAKELVASIAGEADKGETAFSAEVSACTSLYAAAASPGSLKLHPLAAASVVSPALASCYAQYRFAASLSEGGEASDLNANADKARELALVGKEGAARAAAEAALDAEFGATKAAPQPEQEAGMMRLIMCQPVMAAAAKEDVK
jgi:hypothetical protein